MNAALVVYRTSTLRKSSQHERDQPHNAQVGPAGGSDDRARTPNGRECGAFAAAARSVTW